MPTNGATLATGRVLQVNLNGGGVPKRPVERAWVGHLGLTGDAHREFTVHGGPHKAVCLYGIEAIERLQSEGHPVEPGGVGENLTTTGVEWSTLPVGTRARIGEALEIELASPAMPCKTQIRNFSDGRFSRISIDLHPSDSRMYARVLTEGEVKPGDPITVLPVPTDSRAGELLILRRLDRASSKADVAAWRAAEKSGFEIDIVEDGDIAMAYAPAIARSRLQPCNGSRPVPEPRAHGDQVLRSAPRARLAVDRRAAVAWRAAGAHGQHVWWRRREGQGFRGSKRVVHPDHRPGGRTVVRRRLRRHHGCERRQRRAAKPLAPGLREAGQVAASLALSRRAGREGRWWRRHCTFTLTQAGCVAPS